MSWRCGWLSCLVSEPWHCSIHWHKLALMLFCVFQMLLSVASVPHHWAQVLQPKVWGWGSLERAARQRLTTLSDNYWDNTGHTKQDANRFPIFSLKHISMFGLALLLQNLIFKIEERKIRGKKTLRLLKCTVCFFKNVKIIFSLY